MSVLEDMASVGRRLGLPFTKGKSSASKRKLTEHGSVSNCWNVINIEGWAGLAWQPRGYCHLSMLSSNSLYLDLIFSLTLIIIL